MTMNIQPSEIRVLEDHELDLIVGGLLGMSAKDSAFVWSCYAGLAVELVVPGQAALAAATMLAYAAHAGSV